MKSESVSCSVRSDFATPWTSFPGYTVYAPGKNPGVGCHSLLQGICPTQGLKPGLLHFLLSEPPGKPNVCVCVCVH